MMGLPDNYQEALLLKLYIMPFMELEPMPIESVLLISSLVVVGSLLVYLASRAWGVKSWKGVAVIALIVVTIPVVGVIVTIYVMAFLFSLAFS